MGIKIKFQNPKTQIECMNWLDWIMSKRRNLAKHNTKIESNDIYLGLSVDQHIN